jgi:hypothetical protein
MMSDSDIRERLGPLVDPTLDPDQIPRRTPHGLIAALVVLVLCLFGGSIALLLHYQRTAPHQPDPPSGHVYRITDTRHTIFLTKKQHYIAYAALATPILATIAVALFATRRRKPAPIEPT